jgi:luciferase family oxidoreductase group 1
MKYSILDQSPVRAGTSPDESIRETVALAQACEGFGYHRFWVSEHHSSPSVAGSAPEVLMAALAMVTSRIRLGSAGVMLPHYSALKVAEQFRVLEALAPGRIDLGVGRAPGSDGRTAMALNPHAAGGADEFPAQVRDLYAWVNGGTLPVNHPFRAIAAQPEGPGGPELWMLGSSNYGAQLAAHFGLPYCFAYFFSDGQGAEEALDLYRTLFKPGVIEAPYAAITVWAFAAETQERADYFYRSRGIARLMRDRGHYIPLPSPEEAATVALSPAEAARVEAVKAQAFSGVAGDVARRVAALGEALGVQEIAITTTASDPAARRDSYRLLAREFGLGEGALALAS